tara:strand:+ start:615 stop:1232 length:618 start_codon:yes stop_codon:yes gene_type:complete
MKYILLIAALLSAPAFAEFGGSVSLGSDYFFRGVSQNAGSPAASADVSFSASGFYAGVWASQVDYGTDIEVEYDLYVGKGFELSEDLRVDLGYIDYNYSSFDALTDFEESASDVEEVAARVTYKGAHFAYFMGLDAATDYLELGTNLFGVADVVVGDYDGAGWHWQASKTIDVEGVDVTFGYRSFFGDDGVADEKSAIITLTKSF